MALQLLIADRRLDAQNVVGIALGSDAVTRLDVSELRVGHAEALGHACQKLLFARMQRLIRLGDVK